MSDEPVDLVDGWGQWIATIPPTPDTPAFPPPRDLFVADRIEATAQTIHEGYPYRTLFDCRQLAERLVDELLSWDALWPEAEGDCGCKLRGFTDHQPDCLWSTTTLCTCPDDYVSHREGCPEWVLPL